MASLSVAGMPLCCLPAQLVDTVNAHNVVTHYFFVLSSQKRYNVISLCFTRGLKQVFVFFLNFLFLTAFYYKFHSFKFLIHNSFLFPFYSYNFPVHLCLSHQRKNLKPQWRPGSILILYHGVWFSNICSYPSYLSYVLWGKSSFVFCIYSLNSENYNLPLLQRNSACLTRRLEIFSQGLWKKT